LLTLLPGLVLIGFWQWASGRLIREIYVSKPSAIAARLYEIFASGEIYPHLWTTGQELVLGYVIGVGSGIIGGYALGRAPRLANIFEPYVMAFYGIPKIALAPLFIIWFGIGMWSKVALAAIMVFFLVFYNVFSGVRSVDRELVNLTRVMGANERQLTLARLSARRRAVRDPRHAHGHSLQRHRRHRRRIHLVNPGARSVHP
jgi:NitT/TauT family transport system permease protein